MRKERILAIIGIVLLLVAIGLLFLADYIIIYPRIENEIHNRGYDSYYNLTYDVYSEISGEVRANTVIDEISFIFGLCGLCLYPIFHYIMSLLEGLRIKNKKTIISTIFGSVLAVFGSYAWFAEVAWTWLSWVGYMHLLYYLVFSIVMLFRSFKKAKVDDNHLDNTAVPETTGKENG